MDFADGITSLLGPNGCGKSNIVDAIKWVLGEQSTKTLRAGKMEDVIFNGTDSRKPLQVAEVSLVISNEERHLPIDAPEVEIKRRIFRTGESEYYLNKNRVLLKNIRELFFLTPELARVPIPFWNRAKLTKSFHLNPRTDDISLKKPLVSPVSKSRARKQSGNLHELMKTLCKWKPSSRK